MEKKRIKLENQNNGHIIYINSVPGYNLGDIVGADIIPDQELHDMYEIVCFGDSRCECDHCHDSKLVQQ